MLSHIYFDANWIRQLHKRPFGGVCCLLNQLKMKANVKPKLINSFGHNVIVPLRSETLLPELEIVSECEGETDKKIDRGSAVCVRAFHE